MTRTADVGEEYLPAPGSAGRAGPVVAALRVGRRVLEGLAIVGVAAMILHTAVDVSRREFFGGSAAGTIEYVTNYYLIGVAFLGLVVAQKQREHIEVNVLFDRLPQLSRRGVFLVMNLIAVAFVLALAWYGWQSAAENMQQGEHSGVVSLLIWPSRFLVPIGCVAYAILLSADAVKDFASGQEPTGAKAPSEGAL